MFFSKKAKDYFFKTKKNLTSKQNILITFAKKYFFMVENDKKDYKNWYKTLLRIQKKELILAGVLILLAFIFVGISSDICKWLKTEVIYDIVNNKCLKTEVIHDIVNNKLLINIPICIIISGFAIWWWCKIWKDKDIRPYRLGLIISLFIITYYSKVKYANITENISYEHFFIAILGISAIILIIRLCLSPYFTCKSLLKLYLSKNRFKRGKRIIKIKQIIIKLKQKINPLIYKTNNKLELKGFSVDDTEIKLENNQIKYAKTLVKKLKNTDLGKESFAVGITGEWGSGKSTFLNTMKKEIKKEDFAEIVEFNPWLCNSPEQVTQDFFATLIDKLSPKHSTLSRDINKYAKLLNKMAKASLSIFGIDLDLTPSDDSLNKLKDKISNKLAKLPKKVVILIDDTDRLEGNEIFEILRLIRNTADFKNVIYIATYDKEYVTDVLKENKIKDPDNYLEKISQVELHRPKVEGSELWDTLKEEIEANFSNFNNEIKINYSNFSFNDRELVSQILSNYRQVKRFARQFTTYLDYLNNNNLINNFYIIDLFWLELLQTYDKNTYNILAKDRLNLLEVRDNSYILQNKEDNTTLEEKTKKILNTLFDISYNWLLDALENNDNFNKRLAFKENYNLYFALNIPSYKLSLTEMKELYDKEPEEVVKKWLDSGKNEESIVFRFNNYENIIDNKNNLKKHIIGLLYFALNAKVNFKDIKELLKLGKHYDNRKIVYYITNKWFNDKIENCVNDEDFIKLSTLLNKLYYQEFEPSIGQYVCPLIINSKDIENYLNTLIKKYMDSRRNSVNIFDIISENKTLSKIFKNCCVTNKHFDNQGNDFYIKKSIVINTIIKQFNNKTDEKSKEQFINHCLKLPERREFFGNNPEFYIKKLEAIQTNG